MLTLFSTPKAFTGLFGVIQTNAIRSWTMLEPRPEVILFGDDQGTAEICAKLGLRHVPDVRLSGRVPLISDMFTRAQQLAEHDTMTFLNADIILPASFAEMVRRVRATEGRCLAVGRRVDISQLELLDVGRAGWADALEARCRGEGTRMPANCIDHFTFPRGLYEHIPDFAIGRTGYDNWLLWRAEDAGARLVDVTDFCTVIHQRHDYSHGGGTQAVFGGEDARRARALIGHWSRYYGVSHARWRMARDGAIVPARAMEYRLARPRRTLAHMLRFTVPVRRQLIDMRRARRLGRA